MLYVGPWPHLEGVYTQTAFLLNVSKTIDAYARPSKVHIHRLAILTLHTDWTQKSPGKLTLWHITIIWDGPYFNNVCTLWAHTFLFLQYQSNLTYFHSDILSFILVAIFWAFWLLILCWLWLDKQGDKDCYTMVWLVAWVGDLIALPSCAISRALLLWS